MFALTTVGFYVQKNRGKSSFAAKRASADCEHITGLEDCASLQNITGTARPRKGSQSGFDVILRADYRSEEVSLRRHVQDPTVLCLQAHCTKWSQELAASDSSPPSSPKRGASASAGSPARRKPARASSVLPASGPSSGLGGDVSDDDWPDEQTPIRMQGEFGDASSSTSRASSTRSGGVQQGGPASASEKRPPMNKTGVNKKYKDRAKYTRVWKRRRHLEGKSAARRRRVARQEAVDANLLHIWEATGRREEIERCCDLLSNAWATDITLVWDRPAPPDQRGRAATDHTDLTAAQSQDLSRKALTVLAYYRAVLETGHMYCETRCCAIASATDAAHCHEETVRRYPFIRYYQCNCPLFKTITALFKTITTQP